MNLKEKKKKGPVVKQEAKVGVKGRVPKDSGSMAKTGYVYSKLSFCFLLRILQPDSQST